jgi:glycine/D-amino acid oxidase-like deaminating enzyme
MPTSSDCRAAFMEQFDLLVVGGGSGGLACAQRAADYGARVALIESGRLGGTCVNVGCVPKKIMWNASEIHEALADGVDYGFRPSPAGHDWPSLKAKRDAYVQRLNGMYARSLASRKIEHIEGRASFIGPQLITAAGRTLAPRTSSSPPAADRSCRAFRGRRSGSPRMAFLNLRNGLNASPLPAAATSRWSLPAFLPA